MLNACVFLDMLGRGGAIEEKIKYGERRHVRNRKAVKCRRMCIRIELRRVFNINNYTIDYIHVHQEGKNEGERERGEGGRESRRGGRKGGRKRGKKGREGVQRRREEFFPYFLLGGVGP